MEVRGESTKNSANIHRDVGGVIFMYQSPRRRTEGCLSISVARITC